MAHDAHDHDHDHGHGHAHGHGHGHGHSHAHGHHHGPTDTGDWRYAVGLIVNLAFVAIEFTAGFMVNSTALMADAGHNLSDVLGLAMAGGALLMVSRRPPRDWVAGLPDLRSRLDAIPVLALEAPDDILLAAMLRRAFAERSITPSADVIDYLVRRIDRSWTAAQTVVDRLDALHRPVTRAAARSVLEG